MRIWLLTVGEPLPEDATQGKEVRLFRTGQFAQWLVNEGHDVTFFTNTVDHAQRRQRYDSTTVLTRSQSYRVVCLYSRLYKRTVSFARFMSHRDGGKSFRLWCDEQMPHKPDVILSSYPTEELCRAAVEYGASHDVPIVIDTRDLWPDLFPDAFPAVLRPLFRLIFKPMDQAARKTLARADALSGHALGSLNWALDKAGRPRSKQDFVFPFTFSGGRLSPEDKAYLRSGGDQHDKLRIAFMGTLSRRSSGLDLVVDALAALPAHLREKVELTIAGVGDAEAGLRKRVAASNAPVRFLGWIHREEILNLMAVSDFGLLPYTQKDFHVAIPNKFSEYLSAGLPVLSCTDGSVREFIEREQCGVWVEPTASSFVETLTKLIQHPPGKDLQDRALRAYSENFEAKQVFASVLKKLEALCRKELE